MVDDFISLSKSRNKAGANIKGHFYNSSALSGKYVLMDNDLILHLFLE